MLLAGDIFEFYKVQGFARFCKDLQGATCNVHARFCKVLQGFARWTRDGGMRENLLGGAVKQPAIT